MDHKQLVKYLLSCFPGALEFAWTVNNWHKDYWAYGRRFPAHANRLPEAANEWINTFNKSHKIENLPNKKVLFFSGGFNILENCLAISIVLAHRNCDVDFLYFENIQPEQHDQRYSKRKYSYYYKQAIDTLTGAIDGLNMIPLSSVPETILDDQMEEEAKNQALLDTVYIGRRETIDLEEREKELFNYRLDTNSMTMSRLKTLISHNNYDVLVTPNGAVREFGAAFRLANIMRIPTGTFEFWGASETCCVSYGPCVMRMNTNDLWEKNLSTKNKDYLYKRGYEAILKRAGNKYQFFSRRELSDALQLTDQNPIVLICPNVPFDGMFVGTDSIFSSMKEWLISTIAFLIEWRGDINVIIRAHPHELRHDAVETTETIIKEKFGRLPENFHLIPAASTTNTYELMKFTDLGLVYSSTTGIEMASFGIPVINSNFFHYSRRGFTLDPTSVDEYFVLLEKILNDPAAFRLDKKQIDLAHLYADVFFNQLPMAFPWNFQNFWADMNHNSLADVLSQKGEERFGKTFDTLVGRNVGEN